MKNKKSPKYESMTIEAIKSVIAEYEVKVTDVVREFEEKIDLRIIGLNRKVNWDDITSIRITTEDVL